MTTTFRIGDHVRWNSEADIAAHRGKVLHLVAPD